MTYGSPATGELKPGRQAWALDEKGSEPYFRQALDLGINFFDTANVYSSGDSERVLGNFLKANARREAVVIATKVQSLMREEPNGRGLSRKEILFELDESLKRLKTDYVDLYQIHRWDYETPIEETLEALHDAVKAGKVRYIGASSMYAWQFAKSLYLADLRGWTRFVSMQNHYNLLYREEEREMQGLCVAEGIGMLPWSPLARGRLARPWKSEQTEAGGDGQVRQRHVLADGGGRPADGGAAEGDCGEARGGDGDGGAGVAARQAGGDGADCGRDQAASPGGCRGGAGAEADGGGREGAGGAVCAASGAWIQLGNKGPRDQGTEKADWRGYLPCCWLWLVRRMETASTICSWTSSMERSPSIAMTRWASRAAISRYFCQTRA